MEWKALAQKANDAKAALAAVGMLIVAITAGVSWSSGKIQDVVNFLSDPSPEGAQIIAIDQRVKLLEDGSKDVGLQIEAAHSALVEIKRDLERRREIDIAHGADLKEIDRRLRESELMIARLDALRDAYRGDR